jgi:ribonuclease BN (tRNA processing enzyme)
VEELASRRHYGHSAAEYAAELGAAAGARRVLLFHHDPDRRDADARALAVAVAERHRGVCVDAAAEGMEIDL